MIVIKDKGTKSQIYIQRNEITSLPNTNGGIDEEELAKYLEEYATEEYVDNKINDIDLSGYATTEYVDEKVNDVDLSEYATKEYVDGNVVELTKAEFQQLKKENKLDVNKLYLITDSTIALKTINGESIVGDGNIEITSSNVDLSGYATEQYVNEKLGNIETILDNIIGV